MQKIKNYTLILCTLLSTLLSAQLPQNCGTSDRILMMGDSWAQYMYDDGVHNRALDAYGHADKKIRSNVFEISLFSGDPDPQGSYYAVSGSEAREWRDENTYAFLQNVRNQLSANPQIKLVVFSLGGNDVLAGQSDCGWYKNMDLDPNLAASGCGFTNELTFFDKLEGDITFIIDEVLKVRTDIEVLISSYDFPNFNVTTSWLGCFGCDLCDIYACPKRLDLSYDVDGDGSITGSELITDAEINQMMMGVETRRQAIANANPRIHFDNSMGLTHYFYGYPGGSPGTSPYPSGPPNYSPGGEVNQPTYRDNFRLVDIPLWFDAPADPIHLSQNTYNYKAKNQMDRVVFEHVRGLQDEAHHQIFWSEGNKDGYVDILENDIYNTGLRMGDEDTGFFGLDNDYRSILSFNTGNLPDNAVITGASVYFIRSSEEDNPFLHSDRNPVMDIKSGHFGTALGLEVADGTSAASASNVGCFIGNATENKRAIRIDVNPSALQYVNVAGRTQFRLYFDFADWSDEYINFYDGAGNAGLVSPSQSEKNDKPVYQSYTKRQTPNAKGTYTEEIIEQHKILLPKEGFVFEERLVNAETDENGVILETFTVFLVVEHPGLAKYMKDYHNAPANGYAPFIDIAYTMPLPIELTRFDAKKEKRNAHLSWTSATEYNSSGFEIQHSTDASNWTNIGWLNAKGNSTTVANYEFLHTETLVGINYYRLKMFEETGSFEYTDRKSLDFPPFGDVVKVFPNPFNDQLQLSFDFETGRQAKLTLVNVLGEILYEQSMDIPTGQFVYSMPVHYLPQGTYFVTIEMQNEVSMVKVVKR